MIIGCILLRKPYSVQYFAQFLSLTDILYEWQCLLPQNRSQHYGDNRNLRKQVFFFVTNSKEHESQAW